MQEHVMWGVATVALLATLVVLTNTGSCLLSGNWFQTYRYTNESCF